MGEEKDIPKGWKKQYGREIKYDKDFAYAEGKKSLKGGISNPKNWRGGKYEMTHSPYDDRKYLNEKGEDKRKSKLSNNPKLGQRKKEKQKKGKRKSARKRG